MLGRNALGRFALGRTPAAAFEDVTLEADVGAFVITGQDATLQPTGNVTLACDVGEFFITGQIAFLKYSIPHGAGTFTITGQDADFIYGYIFNPETGTYQINGRPDCAGDVDLIYKIRNLMDGSWTDQGLTDTINGAGGLGSSNIMSGAVTLLTKSDTLFGTNAEEVDGNDDLVQDQTDRKLCKRVA